MRRNAHEAPPLSTATNQLQNLAANQGFGFAALNGERDIEWQFGVTIPLKGWTLDADNFETRAHNRLDHNNIGESNIFWPITWSYAQIQGLGTHAALSESLASRPASSCVRESICPGNIADFGRLDLSCLDAGMPRISASGIWTGRPRSEKHVERWL
jgi:hypothetical protein